MADHRGFFIFQKWLENWNKTQFVGKIYLCYFVKVDWVRLSFLLMVIMDMENGDQVSKQGCLCPQDLGGGCNYPQNSRGGG